MGQPIQQPIQLKAPQENQKTPSLKTPEKKLTGLAGSFQKSKGKKAKRKINK